MRVKVRHPRKRRSDDPFRKSKDNKSVDEILCETEKGFRILLHSKDLSHLLTGFDSAVDPDTVRYIPKANAIGLHVNLTGKHSDVDITLSARLVCHIGSYPIHTIQYIALSDGGYSASIYPEGIVSISLNRGIHEPGREITSQKYMEKFRYFVDLVTKTRRAMFGDDK